MTNRFKRKQSDMAGNKKRLFAALAVFAALFLPSYKGAATQQAEDLLARKSRSLQALSPQLTVMAEPTEDQLLSPLASQPIGESLPIIKTDSALLFSHTTLLQDLSQNNETRLITQPDIRPCEIAPSEYELMEGRLSDYWAQELIGADLLKKELEAIPPPETPLLIAVMDDGVRSEHGYKVKNLISHQKPISVLPDLGSQIRLFNVLGSKEKEKFTAIQQQGEIDPFDNNHLILSSEWKVREEIPSFINHSMYWRIKNPIFRKTIQRVKNNPSAIYEAFQALSPPTVIVTASGNKFPEGLSDTTAKASQDFHIIVVGSFSPYGFASEFSQAGREVHILAPSDYYISSNGNGEYRQFGGTSAAAPLVTGALAGFEWAGGYHPDGLDSKILLEKTAIPTLHSHENPRQNGAGLLNAYKLGRAALRLREKCHNQDPFCFKREIRNDDNYRFAQDESLLEELALAFPECAPDTPLAPQTASRDLITEQRSPIDAIALKETGPQPAKTTCAEKQALFDRLRREALLSPERRDLWESLSCIYKQAGFEQNSLMIDRIALAQAGPLERLNTLLPLLKENPIENQRLAPLVLTDLARQGMREEIDLMLETENLDLQYVLAVSAIGLSEGLDILEKLKAIDAEGENAITIAGAVGIRGEPAGARILLHLMDFVDARQAVARAAGDIGGPEGAFVLMQMTDGRNDSIAKETVIRSAVQIGYPAGIDVLWRTARDRDPLIREHTARAAGILGGYLGFEILERLLRDKDPSVRVNVAQAATGLKPAEAVRILRQTAKDPNWTVRNQTAKSLAKIGGDEGLDLLERLYANEPNPDVKIDSIVYVGSYHNNRYEEYDHRVRILQSFIRNRNPMIRFAGMEGAYEMRFYPPALQLIHYLRWDEDISIRQTAEDILE